MIFYLPKVVKENFQVKTLSYLHNFFL